MTRKFKEGDRVFCPTLGMGEVVKIDDDVYCVRVQFYRNSCRYTSDGKYKPTAIRPSLFHLDEALKMFPFWLEEVDAEIKEKQI